MKNLLLIAFLDVKESIRARWFVVYTLVFGGLIALFFIAGVTESQVMGFSGLSRLLLMYIQVTIVILPIFILITTVRSISGDRDNHILEYMLSFPISLSQYYWGKIIGRFITVFLPVFVAMILALVIGAIKGANIPWSIFLLYSGLLFALSAAFLGISFLISSVVKSSEVALGLSFFVWIVLLAFIDIALISLMMQHRLSEEIIIWMSQNFGFIQIADRFTTGSSIMPQKKNPDVPELARGKTGRVVGHLMGLITLMKGQPLAYNKDNQEDKEPLFDTVDTLKDTLRIFVEMMGGIRVNPAPMEQAALKGYATATDLADYLVKKGLPFSDAHETVAHAVKAATAQQVDLSELPLSVLQGFNPNIEADVYECLSLRGSLNARKTLGGTAPDQVRAQIVRHRVRLG